MSASASVVVAALVLLGAPGVLLNAAAGLAAGEDVPIVFGTRTGTEPGTG